MAEKPGTAENVIDLRAAREAAAKSAREKAVELVIRSKGLAGKSRENAWLEADRLLTQAIKQVFAARYADEGRPLQLNAETAGFGD